MEDDPLTPSGSVTWGRVLPRDAMPPMSSHSNDARAEINPSKKKVGAIVSMSHTNLVVRCRNMVVVDDDDDDD